jgi:mono/diheme cytochrome c family protein
MASFRRPLLSFRSACILALFATAGTSAVVVGCGDDDNTVTPGTDGGPDARTLPGEDSGPAEAGLDANAAKIARGKYLVDHVSVCIDCHTPQTNTGGPDMTKYLSGWECFADINGPADGGCINTANLTNDPTGLKNRTDEQIKTMFRDGVRPDGKPLSPVMPYWVFHNMTDEDADAVVAYLRTVPAVEHQVPANDPAFIVDAAAPPIPPVKIPAADGGSAERGRYLAAMAGVCMECHTPETGGPGTPPDLDKPFAGGREFQLPMPPFTDNSRSANLTSHATGLAGKTPQFVIDVLKLGRDRADAGLCPPMPVGPMGAFGGLTNDDARDIANYIIGLPPVANTVQDQCSLP